MLQLWYIMKLRSTTPVSLLRNMRWVAAILIVGAIATYGVVQSTQQASADPYEAKIRQLQSDMSKYQKEADRLNGESITLKNEIRRLSNEKAALQTKIDLTQTQHDKLIEQIEQTEEDIKTNQDTLGVIIADLYVDDTISPIEMLASSKNINEFLDKQEYRNSVRDELGNTIKKVRSLRAELVKKKDEVSKVLAEQKVARTELASRESEQSTLLARTQNDEAEYQKLIKDSKAQIAEARATQAAIRNNINSTGGGRVIQGGLLGDYPWNSSNCPMLGYLSTGGVVNPDGTRTGLDGNGYGCRQCASYVAWRIAKETGIYYSWGNAKDFYYYATRPKSKGGPGYKDLGMNPQPGSIAVMQPGKAGQGYGHVAWVESVAGDRIVVSQYNYDYGEGYGMYSMMEMSKYAFDQFVKIK